MKIRYFLSAAAVVAMTACNEFDPGLGSSVDFSDSELATLNEYTRNFVARYGKIDPNHTWGFGEIGSEKSMGGVI